MRKTSRKLLAVILALVVGVLVSACAPREESGNIRLGDIGWDESQAIANLTKILLEEDMGYTVDIQRLESPPLLFQAVGQGEIDAFQDVWLPNHQAFLDEQEDQVQLLDYWYEGETSFGIAVPTYVDVTSLEELPNSNIDTIYGIEPGTPMMDKINDRVVPTYNLNQQIVEAGTQGMLSQVDDLYKNQEPFAFVAWTPHWMNRYYEYRYLDDPEDAQEELNDPAQVTAVVNSDFASRRPDVVALLNAIRLDEDELNEIEDEARNAGDDYEEGARRWLENNRDKAQSWVDEAKASQE